MTPREVSWRIDAEFERENRELQRVAQLACWVLSPWMPKAKLSPAKLLKRRTKAKKTNWNEWAS